MRPFRMKNQKQNLGYFRKAPVECQLFLLLCRSFKASTIVGNNKGLNENEESHEEKKKRLQSYTSLSQHDIKFISIIIGGILGDTCVEREKPTYSPRVRFKVSAENVEYVRILHKILSDAGYCNPNYFAVGTEYHPVMKKRYSFVRFNTYAFPSFVELHTMFYRPTTEMEKVQLSTKAGRARFIKIIPKNINDYLTPLAIAIWYMDDGCRHIRDGTFSVATDSFTLAELELLISVFKKEFGLVWTYQRHGVAPRTGEIKYILCLSKAQTPIFVGVVKPYIVPTMMYKLGLKEDGSTALPPRE